MEYLRQNSAVSVILGPFVSYLSGATNIDSVSLLAGVTAALLRANSGTTVDLANNSWQLISGSSGNYRLGLSATDTATTGAMRVSISGASLSSNSFLEVWKDFQVVTQNFYDGMFGIASFNVSATTLGATAVSDSGVTVVYHGSGVTVASNTDKTGYSLSADQSSVSIGYVISGITVGSSTEHQQLRGALGLTGTSTATTGDGNLDFLYHIEAGGWIVGSGNTMQFFKNDNSTVVATFNLYDSEGGATYQNVFKRSRSS